MNILNHVAIIMDGNGRWGLKKGKTRNYGHSKGLETIESIIKVSIEKRIPFLTLYTFSTENWNRAAHEVESLMRLFRGYLQNKFLSLVKNNVKVKFIGDPQKRWENSSAHI